MSLLMNIIVLIFEILYYSLFMKFARKEGKFSRYILLFTLITVLFTFLGTNNVYSYFLLILTIIYGLKYIVGLKISLYDMLIIIIMLVINVIIQLPIYIIFFNVLKVSHFITTMIFEILKIIFVVCLKNNMNIYYNKMKKIWDNNNFYIRYIFSCSVFIYVIFTIILLIKLAWEV